MATNGNISKVKVNDNTFSIKDFVARDNKLDKQNPSSTGYIASNIGDKSAGENSVSLGYHNNATGAAGVALGTQSEAAADYSVAIGYETKTNAPYQHAIGKYNLPNQEDIFEIGNGNSNSNRSNLLRVTKTGDMYILNDIYFKGTQDNQSPKNLSDEITRLETLVHNSEYTLVKATANSLGGVMIGDNIDIDRNGKISVTFPEIPDPYVLPKATNQVLGGIKVGDNLTIENDGTLSAVIPDPPDPYILPMATATTLGGIKVSTANGFRLDRGVLSFVNEKLNQENPDGTGYIRMNSSGTVGEKSVSLGSANLAKSRASIALGDTNDVTGVAAAAIGQSNTVNGDYSISVGKSNSLSKDNSIIIGQSNVVSESNSYIVGKGNTITSDNAYTFGAGNTNNAESFLFGKGLVSNTDGQIILGVNNANNSYSLLEIGNGTTNSRSNILTINNRGELKLFNPRYGVGGGGYDGEYLFRVSETGDVTARSYYVDIGDRFVNLFNYIDDVNTAEIALDTRVTYLEENPSIYTLPPASTSTLGGIKVGNNLTIDANGVLSANVDINPINFSTTGYFSHNRMNLQEIGENSFASNGSAIAMNTTVFGYGSEAGKRVETTIEVTDPETGEVTEETEYTYEGTIAFAEGLQTQAQGYCSHTAGFKTIAIQPYQFVIGTYNSNSYDGVSAEQYTNGVLFQVGNGNNESNRSNVLEVYKNFIRIRGDLNIHGDTDIWGDLEVHHKPVYPTSVLTSTQYEQLTPSEKNSDVFYLLTDTNAIYYKGSSYGKDITALEQAVEDLEDDLDGLSDIVATKQDTLIAGDYIDIDSNTNEISVTLYEGDHIDIDNNNYINVLVDTELSDSSTHPVENRVIKARLDEVFQSVSNGKIEVAAAITDKGVPTAADDTFSQMAYNISQIEGGGGGSQGVSIECYDLENSIEIFTTEAFEGIDLRLRMRDYIELI